MSISTDVIKSPFFDHLLYTWQETVSSTRCTELRLGRFTSQLSEVLWERAELVLKRYKYVLNFRPELLRAIRTNSCGQWLSSW